ncbi:uncharacterized protein CcaverHIS019_0310850 [Cutaneotrichosporon cavernicola]|uniref:Cytoplasmic protein n=1 Tax=Cutaneotrichosporon cavernicola TaxID=279322 RepID=A0AA48L307_9TREE|nr:uncharacterized protein CcaverHIS019_0310850 [Cutaneotrichosporon cavernicola]BEI91015.1 hypothetical protein CcaverHIS019_0310850 [Cutaneotrichosporon cavernicola]BEI98794.1 hypothetical protein CcaverHIS631_0310930 [Cutaneotrichosporon cavernicola]BEJ06565.1 hypothetical protein CcaverHIS641_0310870 [Cutaneotrichosporon cavernicola]
MRAAVFLLFIALAHAERIALHGDRHDHGAELPSPVASDEEVPQTVSLALASSSYLASPSAALPGHDHGHGQPPGHNHNSHAPVREVLDDIGLHEWHDFPPTYMDADFRLTKDSVIFGEVFPEGWDPESVASHPQLMLAHVVCMAASYFVLLPIALALRAAGHPLHHFLSGASLGVAILGWCAGAAYKAAMPDLYAGAKHGGIGNILLLTQITMAIVDSLTLIKRSMGVYRSGIRDWKQFFHALLRYGGDDRFAVANRYEMIWIPDEHDDGEVNDRQRVIFTIGGDDLSRVASPEPITPLRQSTGSDGTLHDSPTTSRNSHHMFEMGAERLHKMGGTRSHGAFDQENTPAWTVAPDSAPQQASRCVSGARALQIVLTWVRRTQVILAYVAVCTGIPVYVGMCRAGFINTCAAHIVKGSIFFGYGVLTFARYLGAYADLGWAWNRKPVGSRAVSAEMVECAVIFTYGATNTWMERFGSKAGDPYTVKQVQHISIAVMFAFGGLAGCLLESVRVRKLLGSVISTNATGPVREPPTYGFSFNPFPALVIAITGLAMAMHHQDYVFQVQIHSLWGVLLAGGSLFRFLTYCYLWLRPPTDSMLPSRPPTEVLTSFGWAAGGIVFMLSDEEVAFAAMRSGFDDMMAFLNFTVALTCLVFCWIVVVMAVKGFALVRVKSGIQLAMGDEESV